MTEPIKDQLSAFLDNELPKAEFELLLKRLGTDTDLRGSLERYVLIGESLRASAPASAQVSRQFSERVRAAVEQEANSKPAVAVPARTRWSRPLTGFAVAAGAAAGAVLMVRLAPFDSPGLAADNPRPQTELARNLQIAPSPPLPVPARDEARRWRTVPQVSATQLTHYVVAHSEYSSPLERRNVLTGVLGVARPVNDVIDSESER